MSKTPISVSLDPENIQWADENARALGYRNRSDMVNSLIEALRFDRLLWLPPPDPFPGNKTAPSGEAPSNPVLVAQ